MKISIKREQSQAGLSFAERLRVGEPCSGMRKEFRPKVKRNKLLLLLALLMTAATGAWAQDAKHRITATLNFTSTTKQKTLDVTLPYETTIGAVYTAITGQAPASNLSPTAAEVTSGTNVSIGTLSGWGTPVNVTADGDATVGFTATVGNGTITLSVAPIYTVKLADGTQDAKNWTIASGDNSVKGDVADGLTGLSKKDAVTLTYGGHLKVKSVTATSDAAPAGPPSWKLTLSSPAKDLCIIANGGVIAQQTLDVASTEFTVEMPELTSQTVNIFATDGSGNCWYCTQENMSFASDQTYQSSPTMTALDEDNSKPLYKITATSDVTIPDGKTVVLSGVNISGGSITCDGSVTMILMGANTVTATDNNAAIKIGGPGTTLTITGSGSLTAQGGLEAAGIGTDRNEDGELSFGNIVINGGTVTATGGKEGAGIGTGLADGQYASASITCGDITINGGTVTATGGLYGAGIGTGPTMSDGGSASITCGDITINGGTVTATGGNFGPGIGTGVFMKYGGESASNRCGNITIGAGVTSVTATKGSSDSPNSIGKGYAQGGTQNYGTITIGGTVYDTGVTANPFTYTPSN